MKYIKGHLKKNLSRWMGKKWYHQRFDGCPYFILFVAEAQVNRHKEKKQGNCFKVHYCFFEEEKADWYMLQEDIERITNSLIEQLKKNAHLGDDLIALWQDDKEKLYKLFSELEGFDLSVLTDEKLMTLHNKLVETFLDKFSYSSLIDGFALGSDKLIEDMVQKVYESSAVLKKKMRFSKVFSTLTAPTHLSFINKAEVDLLKLALRLQKAGKEKLFVEQDVPAIIKNLQDSQELAWIKQHQKKYFWLKNNYHDANTINLEEFLQELKSLFCSKIDIASQKEYLEQSASRNTKEKEKLLEMLEVPELLLRIIKFSDQFTHWQDERKKSTFHMTHQGSRILEEIGKRIGIPLEEMKYMSHREVSKVFEQTPSRNMLKDRLEACVYYWDEEGFESLQGSHFEEVKKTLLGESNFSDIDDFRGLVAMTGKVTGKVKVLKSAKEVNSLEDGNILVAVMTRPDYVPAMKRAAGIITDEGGITCHAAIISRELTKPCIIGTKIATKTLKDGDLIELNANHGWVRILKRA